MALKEYEGYFSLQNPAVGRVTGRGPLGTRPYDSTQNTSIPPLGAGSSPLYGRGSSPSSTFKSNDALGNASWPATWKIWTVVQTPAFNLDPDLVAVIIWGMYQ